MKHVLLICLLCSLFMTPTYAADIVRIDEVEKNDSTTSAQPITSSLTANDVIINGTLIDMYDDDYYKLTFTEPTLLTVTLSQLPQSTIYASLLADNGELLESWYNFAGTTSYKMFTLPVKAGTYFIRVNDEDKNTATNQSRYLLKLSATAATKSELEPNSTRDTAQPLLVNETMNGFFGGHENTADYYKFTVAETSQLTVSLQTEAKTNPRLVIYDANEQIVDIIVLSATKNIPLATGLRPGAYTLLVDATDGTYANYPYQLTTKLVEKAHIEIERNDSFAEASALPLATAFTGHLYASDDTDIYRFTVGKNGLYTMNIGGSRQHPLVVALYNKSQQQRTVWTVPVSKTTETTTLPSLTAGTYYAMIYNGPKAPDSLFTTYTVQVAEVKRIGTITITAKTMAYTLTNGKLTASKTLAAGSSWPVYETTKHGYRIDANLYVKKAAAVQFKN